MKSLNYLPREIIGTPCLETPKIRVEKKQDVACGNFVHFGSDVVIDE